MIIIAVAMLNRRCIPNVHVDMVQSFKMAFCEIFLIPARDLTSSCFIRLDMMSEL